MSSKIVFRSLNLNLMVNLFTSSRQQNLLFYHIVVPTSSPYLTLRRTVRERDREYMKILSFKRNLRPIFWSCNWY